jgi:hypothetical protein
MASLAAVYHWKFIGSALALLLCRKIPADCGAAEPIVVRPPFPVFSRVVAILRFT